MRVERWRELVWMVGWTVRGRSESAVACAWEGEEARAENGVSASCLRGGQVCTSLSSIICMCSLVASVTTTMPRVGQTCLVVGFGEEWQGDGGSTW